MTALTFQVIITPTGNTDADKNAALLIVNRYNALYTPPLPTSPQAELLNSAEKVLGDVTLMEAWDSYVDQANIEIGQEQNVRELWRGATDQGKQDAIIALQNNQET